MNENNGIAQENVQQNSPNGQKPANAKGLIIIIIIVAAVIIGYFIMQSLDKNGGSSKADLSVISEEDRLPLGMSNLQGKWERYDGKIKYIINFKSNNELVFTQYDEAGNVSAESEAGTYEAKDDILSLTMTAGGQATAATCNAAVSVEKLVIKTVEGSGIFEGVYVVEEETRKEMEKLEGIINGTQASEPDPSDNTGDNNGGNGNGNNNENNEGQPVTSDITTSTEEIQTNPPETEPPVSQQDVRLSDAIMKYLQATKEDIWGEDYPIYMEFPQTYTVRDVECDGEVVTLYFNVEELEDGTFVPSNVSHIWNCPVKILFEPKIQGNTLLDLDLLLGDKVIYEYDEYDRAFVSAEINGYRIEFLSYHDEELTDETLIKDCRIYQIHY